MTPPTPPRGGRPRGTLNSRGHQDEARLALHDAADTLARLDVEVDRLIREAWSSVQAAAHHLGTAAHLPACEQAATMAVAS